MLGGAALESVGKFIAPIVSKIGSFFGKGAGNAKYYTKTGEPIWPRNDGFVGTPKAQTLKPGTLVDRYGYESGSFVSPAGTTFENRALPASYRNTRPLKTYKVVKPVETQAGKIESWFGQPGGGTQYKFNKSILELLDEGILVEVK